MLNLHLGRVVKLEAFHTQEAHNHKTPTEMELKTVKNNCPNVSNADQKDSDGDGKGDVCDDNK